MKRGYFCSAIIVILASLCMAGTPAFGVTLTYNPTTISTTMAAGTSSAFPLTIGIEEDGSNRTYYAWLQDAVTGSIPSSWLGIVPATTFLSPSSPQVNATLTITVPAGTPSGTYTAVLLPKAMAGHRFANAGSGVTVEVRVPVLCSGVPQIKNMSVDPAELWPPDHSLTEVTVTGTIEAPGGCNLVNAGYSVEDEYGTFTGTGSVSVRADQGFQFTVPVEAWREGRDKDGRTYRIRVFGEDEAGMGVSEVFTVLVPHDQRTKKAE